jgi:hypothetical protein
MSDKVYGGTKKETISLCKSCQHGTCTSGFNSKEYIHCGYTGKDIEFPVATCSKYGPSTTASIEDMKKIAWVIESRNRGPWGFNREGEREVIVRPPGSPEEYPTQGPVYNREKEKEQK